MDGRGFRGLLGALILPLLVVPLTAGATVHAAVAASCQLTAPASVGIGATVNILGSGFPATTTVDVSVTLDGGTPDRFTVGSDANGAFEITLTTELQDVGRTTVDASVGAICSARTAFTVVGPSATPAPSGAPASAPGTTPVAGRTPAPTAAPPGGGVAGATPPRSDSDSPSAPPSIPPVLLLGLSILLLGVAGLVAAAIAQRSRS